MTLTNGFPISVSRNLFFEHTEAIFSPWCVEVSVAGYQPRLCSLAELAGPMASFSGGNNFSIRLQRSLQSSGPLRDLVGEYVYALQDDIRVGLHLREDCRATLVTSYAGGRNDEKHFRATVEGEELVLFSREGESRVYLPLAWDDRLYLIEKGRALEFRDAVRDFQEPRYSPFGRFLLRAGDWKGKLGSDPPRTEELRAMRIDEFFDRFGSPRSR